MRRFVFRIMVICTALLTACTPTDDFEAGRPVDREELASLSAELFTKEVEPDTDDGFHTREVVYWTEGGTVYHYDRACYHLKRAENVISGSVKHAHKEGKDRACATCAGD